MNKTHRLQIDFTDVGLQQLNKLREFTGYQTYEQVVKHAFAVLWCHMKDSQGLAEEVELTPLDQDQ